ncbi:MarR family transcriptional regulator [Arthrobacter sp. PAMC25564]|uniref:MarR family winged helix-turn-helix transcriptional regulator n=1 Tax=Arthrobacter sp. PAMC25564 TaxID=2565366 RepID=UPI0010A2832D|nr:MarR family transcriptional regulator [Arthrobacter sp. PAMC25564]QCB98271.1 MarR family transcriptional regulator [Arthrobacter sp. PAMC25564]
MSNPTEGNGVPGSAEDPAEAALTAVEQQMSLLWRRGRSISHQLSRQVHPDMDPAAYGLLSVIRKQGPIRLTELASCIGVGKPSVSRQVAFLENLGLVSKEADPVDGRAQSIRLTPKGEEKMHQVQDARREVFRERLAEWPAEELQALARYMAKLNSTYERDGFPKDD